MSDLSDKSSSDRGKKLLKQLETSSQEAKKAPTSDENNLLNLILLTGMSMLNKTLAEGSLPLQRDEDDKMIYMDSTLDIPLTHLSIELNTTTVNAPPKQVFDFIEKIINLYDKDQDKLVELIDRSNDEMINYLLEEKVNEAVKEQSLKQKLLNEPPPTTPLVRKP